MDSEGEGRVNSRLIETYIVSTMHSVLGSKLALSRAWPFGLSVLAILGSMGCKFRDASEPHGLLGSAGLEYSANDELNAMRVKFVQLDASLTREFLSFPTLETVEINECRRDGTPLLLVLAQLPQLQSLTINNVQLSDEEFSQLRGAPKLVSLELSQTGITGEALSQLSELSLKRLSICDSTITQQGLKHLTKMQELEELELQLASLSAASIPPLAQLRNLKTLRILRINFNFRVNGGLNCLEGADSLESLDISGDKLTERVVRAIVKLRGLKSLKLGRCIIDDEGVELLLKLNQLEHLEIADCSDLTDRSLTLLSGLTKLKSLFLSETNLEGRTLPHLARIQGLKNLTLYGKPIDENLLTEFHTLKPNCKVSTSLDEDKISQSQSHVL